jgi:hypothetical protein
MAEHSKLEKRVDALERAVHRLEAAGRAQADHFNFAEDFVKQGNLRKNFRKAQDEQTLQAIGASE